MLVPLRIHWTVGLPFHFRCLPRSSPSLRPSLATVTEGVMPVSLVVNPASFFHVEVLSTCTPYVTSRHVYLCACLLYSVVSSTRNCHFQQGRDFVGCWTKYLVPGTLLSTELVLSQHLRCLGGPVTGETPRVRPPCLPGQSCVLCATVVGDFSPALCTHYVLCSVLTIQQVPQETQQ